jgi:hypothetical protein
MSTPMIWSKGQGLFVTTCSAGTLNLFTYDRSIPTSATFRSDLSTGNAGTTRFVISFTHNYSKFAFMWEGAGEAVYSIGTGLERKPVGKSWSQASQVAWGASAVTTADVVSLIPDAGVVTVISEILVPRVCGGSKIAKKLKVRKSLERFPRLQSAPYLHYTHPGHTWYIVRSVQT